MPKKSPKRRKSSRSRRPVRRKSSRSRRHRNKFYRSAQSNPSEQLNHLKDLLRSFKVHEKKIDAYPYADGRVTTLDILNKLAETPDTKPLLNDIVPLILEHIHKLHIVDGKLMSDNPSERATDIAGYIEGVIQQFTLGHELSEFIPYDNIARLLNTLDVKSRVQIMQTFRDVLKAQNHTLNKENQRRLAENLATKVVNRVRRAKRL